MSMKKLSTIALVALLWLSTVSLAFSQEATTPETKKPGVDFYLNITSSYFFRGTHVFAPATREWTGDVDENGDAVYDKDVAFPFAPALQPGVTFATPIDGLSFDIWTSWALTARDAAEVKSKGDTADNLKSLDEVDFLVSYEFENKIGSFNIFYLTYITPNASAISVDNGEISTLGQYTELGFSYTAPLPLSPTLYVANDINYGLTYMALSLSHELALGKDMALTPGITYGVFKTSGDGVDYGDDAYLQIDLPFSMSMGDMSYNLGASMVYFLNSDADPSTQFFITAGVTYSL